MSVERRPSQAGPTLASPEAMALKYPASTPWRPNATVLPTNTCSALVSPTPSPSSQQPGDRLSHHHHQQAMEFFPDGGFVRLQSRGNSKYVHAEGDWERVVLRPLALGPGPIPSSSLDAVWRVQHWVSEQGAIFVLLQNAAYGRYLSFSPRRAPRGHRGRRAVQDDVYEPIGVLGAFVWRWRVERVDLDQNFVRLRYADYDLRANGRHLAWNTRVTADVHRGNGPLTTMMQWTVHAVAATPVPIPLPVTPPEPQIQGGRRGVLLWRRTGVHQHPPRTIRHVRADDEGNFDQDHQNWPTLLFDDHSVFNLRTQLGQLQVDWTGDMLSFTLCMRPGLLGRLMPLVTDLPRSLDPMNIIVLRTGSPAAAALVYPQIAPPAQ